MRHVKTGKKVLALLCALLMTAALLPPAAVYGTTTDSSADADAVRKEYEQLQQQINDKRQEMNDLKNELDKIKNDKANTQQKKNLLDQRNSALTEEINLLEAQIELNTSSIAANEALEQQQTELFHKQIRMEEEQGTVSYWSVLFKATSFSDLISRIDFINEIVRYNHQVIDNLRQTGAVKVSGVEWSARSVDGRQIAADTAVRIDKIEGAKVLVSAVQTKGEK